MNLGNNFTNSNKTGPKLKTLVSCVEKYKRTSFS